MGDLAPTRENNETHKISAVIFDLDGTLLNTEQVTKGVLKEYLGIYGKVPDKEKEIKRLGMTQKQSVSAIIEDYDLPLSPHQYIQEILPFYQGKWQLAKALPGVNRLMAHLHKQGIPIALASNSLRKNIDGKLAYHEGWKERFAVILGSDQVRAGKPEPDIFLEAASRMNVHPADCLVIEDSVVGVKAGKAAGMKVVAVPSVQTEIDQYSIADSVLHSILELQPELWGLPPFGDCIDNVLPVEPVFFKGFYSNGRLREFTDDILAVLPDQVFGIYVGWAKIDSNKFLKIVVSIGWENDCSSSNRNIQTFILDGNNEDLHDYEMELVLVGYIRGSYSMKTTNFLDILDEDKSIASAAFCHPEFSLDACKSVFPQNKE
ncbi:bifunctional riboflavin kinase/FMN phosphatase-like [Ipomoea triloba]|uniref:bifunctional riboflavin kinase/FMN phosphatase-like n=1 Tax=Ipomoea triloba TaxID=35885 RepID=UPI00125D004C|nr:bifunctional riboflavin kinase/FMN phosphatase-like [Ipomoea triloba]